jgi:hypothetical protein
MPCLYIRREKRKKTFNPLFALSGTCDLLPESEARYQPPKAAAHLVAPWCDSARARGIAAEPPSRRSAKRKAVKVMERIARRERRNAAKRLAQNHQKTKKIKPIENKLF